MHVCGFSSLRIRHFRLYATLFCFYSLLVMKRKSLRLFSIFQQLHPINSKISLKKHEGLDSVFKTVLDKDFLIFMIFALIKNM